MKMGLYQHYSGKYYQVIGIGRHSETLEEVVIYRALYDDYGLWVRPRKMFAAMVAPQTARFKFIKEIDNTAPLLRETN